MTNKNFDAAIDEFKAVIENMRSVKGETFTTVTQARVLMHQIRTLNEHALICRSVEHQNQSASAMAMLTKTLDAVVIRLGCALLNDAEMDQSTTMAEHLLKRSYRFLSTH